MGYERKSAKKEGSTKTKQKRTFLRFQSSENAYFVHNVDTKRIHGAIDKGVLQSLQSLSCVARNERRGANCY